MSLPESDEQRRIRVYSRPGCHLCELLVDELMPLIRGRLDLEVVNIDERPEWTLKYGTLIPLVEYNGETVCNFHLDTAAIRTILRTLPGS
jgi:hypothetical protein